MDEYRLINDLLPNERNERFYKLKCRSPMEGCLDETVLHCFWKSKHERAFSFGSFDDHGIFIKHCKAHLDIDEQYHLIWIGWYCNTAFQLRLNNEDNFWSWKFTELRDGHEKRSISLHLDCNNH